MSPAQHSPERPRQCSGSELATSNSTANRFLGTPQRSWMTNSATSPTLGLPNKSPVTASKPRVLTNLPSRAPKMPPLSGFTTASQPHANTNEGRPFRPSKRHAADPFMNSSSDRPAVLHNKPVPVSPITPGAKFPDSTAGSNPGVAHALPAKQIESVPRRLPVLPSPEPSNDSHPSPVAISEANHQTAVVAPAVSTLARPQPATGEVIVPTFPAIAQPKPASTFHSQSPSVTVSSLPSNSPASVTPAPASLNNHSIWKHAINRLKILQEKSTEQHSLSETVEFPRLRILEDACLTQDMFYLALHQVYCITSFAPSQLQSLRPFGIQPEVGMNVIRQLLVDNQRLSGDFLKWCVSYPSPLLSMLELADYKTALSQVAACLSNISKHWLPYEQELRARAYPPQVDELVDRLSVKSPTLQSIIFTALSRRLFGPREQLLKACSSLFERDKANYKKRQLYSKEQRQKEISEYSSQYRQLCMSYGVFPRPNNTHASQKSNNMAPNPAPIPAQSPASTTAGQPSPALPPGPIFQQGQHHPPFPHYHQPPVAQHGSPTLPRPDPRPFIGRPPNSTLQQGQQFSYPPPSQTLPLSNAQNIPQNQSNLPVPPVAPSREDARQGPTPVATPNSPVSTPQLQSTGFERAPGRGPKPTAGPPMPVGPAGPTRQTHVGHPAYPPNSHTNIPQSYAGSAFHMPYSSPHHMAPSMPAPVMYGQPAMPPTHSMPQLATSHVTPMHPQLESWPLKHQSRQASSTSFSPHSLLSNVTPGSSPTIRQGNNGSFQQGTNANTTPPLVHYFSDFAVPATKLTSNRSAFKFPFQVSREALQKRPRLFPQGGNSAVLTPHFSDGDVSYRLRCIKCDGQLDINSLPVWCRAESSWPDVVYIHVNNKELHRPHNSKNTPIDINRFLEPGTNEIRLNVLHNAQQRARNVTYAVAVEVLRFASTTSFQNQVRKLSSELSLQQIRNRLGMNNDDEDLMIMDNFISIDLRDPFTTRIFDTPIRGVNCTHRECFDLSTFLQTITFTPSAIGKRTPYLRCPICRKDIRPHLIILDEFLLGVRAALSQQQKSETAKCIRVKSDGSWEAVLETEDENKTPSKKLKRDRASFESDLFKTEQGQSRETSLSRIPEAVEVIELD